MNLIDHNLRPGRFACLLVPVAVLLLAASTGVEAAGVEISEFMASNDSGLTTVEGLFEDWVEIHNDSGSAVDLAGWYLTDDPADLRKWQFPSTAATSSLADGGYLVVFADNSEDAVIGNELHAGFKLNAGGEFLALIEPDGETVAYQYTPEFPDQSADVSYGIDAGSGAHAYFASPTPGTANGQAIADAVQFSVESGTFTSAFSLVLSVVSPGTSIRYTLDGSIPTASSPLYGSAINVTTTTRVRARSFKSGLVNGPVVSETYFHLAPDAVAFSSELPLVVIENFGAGEVPHPDSPTRQPGQVMIFEPVSGVSQLTSYPAIASRAGIRRRGESSLRNTADKPNLSLETWGEVDEENRSIKPLGLPAESDWILFAPWAFDRALMRNSFIYEVSNEMGRYAVRTRFVEVFLNRGGGSMTAADYYGVYVLMEKIKQGADRVDVEELPVTATSEPEITGGYIWKKDKIDADKIIFNAAGKEFTHVYPQDTEIHISQRQWLTDHIDAIDAQIPNGNYASLLDVTSFADHHIFNVFAQNADGLQWSTFYFKNREGLVEMGPIWDFDRSMGCDNDARPGNPEVWSFATDGLFFFHSSGPLWFRSLALNDAEFWMVWADRWQAMRDGPLSDTAISERIEGYRAELVNAAPRNFDRWGNISASQWPGKVDDFKTHLLDRARWIDEQLVDPPVFSHPGGQVASGFQLSITGPTTRYYTLNGSDPRAVGGSAAGATYGGPVTITGNTLVKARCWNGASFSQAPSSWPWSPLTRALFVVDPAPLAVTELMYHPRPPEGAAEDGFTASDFEFIELYNTGSSVCRLVGVQGLDGVEFDLTDAVSSTLGAGAYGVLVRNMDAFKARYPNWGTLPILGTFTGRLSDRGERLQVGYALTNLTPRISFDYEDDWYPCTDGEGFSLVLDDPQSAPSTWDGKLAWRPSAARDGSPGTVNPAPAYAQGSVVINEVLSHQDTDNPGDWIELHNTTGSSIPIGGWFLSDSRGDLKKYTLPGGMVIPAYGYVTLTEYHHFGSAFALSEHGDSVYLSAGSGGVLSEPAYREVQSFGGQARDITFGRYQKSNGVADFPALVLPTMGATNAAPRVGPVVIDEIMYHPPVGGHEYLVLRNTSGTTVPLYDPAFPSNVWKVSGIDFVFPPGVQLTAQDSLLLVREPISPAQFRSAYGVPGSVEIFNYAGAMDNDADTIVIKQPSHPEAGTGYVPYRVVEQVKYNDSAPWPVEADALGKALHRINPMAYANDVVNWQADDASYAPLLITLTVHAGTGDGAYTIGEVVPIQADAAAPNQAFVEWSGHLAGVAHFQAPATTVTVPGQDVTITALYSSNAVFIAEDAVWKYHDLGQDLGIAWRAPGYDDSAWPSGEAQLGYGDGDETTEIAFGGDATNKHITSYFRIPFTVDDHTALESATLRLLRDDGAVVYINGNEVVREVMPENAIDYRTPANATVGGSAENTFYTHDIAPTAMVDGVNVMAVEIHQREPDSSDISFAAELAGVWAGATATSDGDADGMYDAWEIQFFGSTEAGVPHLDGDSDRVRNIDEFVAGTRPNDPASLFRIEQVQPPVISWIPVPGRTYSVYWTDDLMQPFVLIAPMVSGGSYTDTLHPSHAINYYRVKVELD